ncbi:hypothetical protein L1049_004300 [Liquidambar formosana]|uniref:Uncharacterized protein n=1 Tax=Liquidambar formosana TaxID=63359 RepID=A0AAP0RP25_LIQFO
MAPATTATKMKSRLLRASICTFLTGKKGEHGIISVKPKATFFNFHGHSYRSICYRRTLANCQLQGIRSQESLHSSSDEDDDFAELGLPLLQGGSTVLKLTTKKPEKLSQGGSTVLKLMTEKSEHFKKTDPARKASSSTSLHAESNPTSTDIRLKQGNPIPGLHLKFENDSEVPRLNVNSKTASNCKNSSSITIENIPSVINLPQLKEAISIFGKITNASMRTVPNELDCCDVVFESVESSSRAVSVGGITVRSFYLPIRPLHVPETVTIRISNISTETDDSEIHFMCKSYCHLDGLVRKKDDVVDALFSVKDNSETQSILNKLNHTIIDDSQWSAHVLPRDSASEVMSSNGDVQSRLAELRRQFCIKELYLEDLEALHFALVHLEGHPAANSRKSNDD